MRLLRRSLLCLLVGLIAFGVAGWLLRPRPNWVVECAPADAETRLLNPDRPLNPDEPIWIRQTISTADGPVVSIAALDSQTGAERRRWPLTYDEGRYLQFFGTPGELIATSSGKGTTRFRVFNADTGAAVERELPAYWAPGGAGTSAWQFQQRVEGDLLHIVDLVSGRIKSWTLNSPSAHMAGREPYGDLSPDGQRFAACTLELGVRPSALRFQIWSLDPVALLREATAPLADGTSEGEIDHLHWTDRGRLVELEISSWRRPDDQPHRHEHKFYNPDTNSFVPPPPMRRRPTFPTPDADAEIVTEYVFSPMSAIPDALLIRLPESWLDTGDDRLRWRRPSTGESRGVGCRHVADDPQVRANMVVAMCQAPGRIKTLESWPLPPRDTRLTTLAAAALFAASTWWLCESRYRRRSNSSP